MDCSVKSEYSAGDISTSVSGGRSTVEAFPTSRDRWLWQREYDFLARKMKIRQRQPTGISRFRDVNLHSIWRVRTPGAPDTEGSPPETPPCFPATPSVQFPRKCIGSLPGSGMRPKSWIPARAAGTHASRSASQGMRRRPTEFLRIRGNCLRDGQSLLPAGSSITVGRRRRSSAGSPATGRSGPAGTAIAVPGWKR